MNNIEADSSLLVDLDKRFYCVQDEWMMVGGFYKKPDLFWQYSKVKPSDLYDLGARFFYSCFIEMRRLYEDGLSDEVNVVAFMTQDDNRFSTFMKYGGYEIIRQWSRMSHEKDFKSYYAKVKKYSFLREFKAKGFPVEKIMELDDFDKLTAQDIYRILLYSLNRVNVDIMAEDESVIVNSTMQATTEKYILAPQMGISTPWDGYNIFFRGCRLGKVMFEGMLSNEGKTRKMMELAAHVTLIEDKSFLIMSNEMDEEDLRSCFLVTVLNNPEYKQYHGVDIMKPEREYVMGVYFDDNGKQVTREVDEFGFFTETDEEYRERLYNTSSEYRKILKVSQWIDEKREKNLYFKDMGLDYSDQAIELEILKHKEMYGIEYFSYDTLKGYQTDEWTAVKQTATRLKELCKNEHVFLYAVFQMTDDSVFCDIFDLTSNNIANAKQLKHVADILTLSMKLKPENYGKYVRIPFEQEGMYQTSYTLDKDKVYYGVKIDKNRAADKSKLLLFEVDLNYNIWQNVGYLAKK